MATSESEVTNCRTSTASQSNRNCGTCFFEEINLEEAPYPMYAVLPPLLAQQHNDNIISCMLERDSSVCGACQGVSKESCFRIHCRGLPCTEPSSRLNSSEMANEAISIDDEPTNDAMHSRYHAGLLLSTKTARCLGYITSIPSKVCHKWIGSLLGLGSLTLAIVSLLMYTVRSYRMAVWTTRNDELQACTGLIQVRDSRSSEFS